jgi:hypothetical protein
MQLSKKNFKLIHCIAAVMLQAEDQFRAVYYQHDRRRRRRYQRHWRYQERQGLEMHIHGALRDLKLDAPAKGSFFWTRGLLKCL